MHCKHAEGESSLLLEPLGGAKKKHFLGGDDISGFCLLCTQMPYWVAFTYSVLSLSLKQLHYFSRVTFGMYGLYLGF